MATRATGFALLASNSVQEATDFALIAQAATLEARVGIGREQREPRGAGGHDV